MSALKTSLRNIDITESKLDFLVAIPQKTEISVHKISYLSICLSKTLKKSNSSPICIVNVSEN